jgi:hypothetical protein
MFLARPVAVLVSTAAARFTGRARTVIAWAGLRGAVPVVLATFPVIEGVPDSLEFFNIVFFAVLLSTVLQGATFEPLAQALGVTETEEPLRPPLRVIRSGAPGAQILTVRPWQPADGDPAYPSKVLGTRVRSQLLARLDQPGALVMLDDGRYAVTGPLLGVGPASALQADARRRVAQANSDAERAWWRDVIGELAR